jgi:hypothetical protein
MVNCNIRSDRSPVTRVTDGLLQQTKVMPSMRVGRIRHRQSETDAQNRFRALHTNASMIQPVRCRDFSDLHARKRGCDNARTISIVGGKLCRIAHG